MCGICGIFDLNNKEVDTNLLLKMTSIMKHRGPDGSGIFTESSVGLGHRRLSIIDIEGGSQPLTNKDNTIHLVFNGEIYNYIELQEELMKKGHRFKTKSDTEVILHGYEEWGIECVHNFNGIFAFALWDSRLKRLFLARDHLGVKPLYYTFLNNKFIFASEIKSILANSEYLREVDIASLDQLFTFRYVPSPNTLFKNIKKMPPGHYMIIDSDNHRIERYWNYIPDINNEPNEKKLIKNYQELLEDAIKLQLRSDVPVGLFLSSGIDSSSILAIMRKSTNKPIYTFTIGFEDGEQTNETDDARMIAKMFDTDHTEMIVTPKDYEKYYENYLWDLEEPVGNETAAAFYFVSKIASEKVKVVLSGQGADEPWAGYHRHIGVKLSEIYSKLPFFLTEKIIKKTVQAFPRNERLKRGVIALNEADMLTRFAKIYSFYSSEMKSKLFRDWMKEELSGSDHEAKEALRHLLAKVGHLDPVSQMLYIDTRSNLPDDLLMVSDKTSMTNSIESRVPFLDYRLVEFIETIPSTLKLKGFKGKYLHKKALEKYLPKKMIYRKKKGFANPIDKWMRGKMGAFLNDCLLSERSAVNKYFNREYVMEILSLHESRKEDYMRHINMLVSFELWHQTFINN